MLLMIKQKSEWHVSSSRSKIYVFTKADVKTSVKSASSLIGRFISLVDKIANVSCAAVKRINNDSVDH